MNPLRLHPLLRGNTSVDVTKFRSLVKAGFSLFKDTDQTLYRELPETTVLAYSTHGFSGMERHLGCTFDMNYHPRTRVAYLVGIEIPASLRGQGYGQQLYLVVEAVARELHSFYLEQTPSGTTPSGESRMDYLLRRGYVQHGISARKSFP